jgi:hypothetical protein
MLDSNARQWMKRADPKELGLLHLAEATAQRLLLTESAS